MNKSLWTMLPIIALVATACKKEDDKDPIDTTPVEDDTFDTSAAPAAIEAFAFLIRFGFDAATMQAVTVDTDGNDLFPGVYYTVGDVDSFRGGGGDNCAIQIVWEDPIDMATWGMEVDADVAFQANLEDASVYTNCANVYPQAEIDSFVSNFVTPTVGWAVMSAYPRLVRDWIDEQEEDRDDYLGGGLYGSTDDEEFDDNDFEDFGYAFLFETEGSDPLEAVIDGDMYVPVDPENFYTTSTVPGEDTDTLDTDTPPDVTVTTLTTGLWNIGWIYFYTLQ